MPNMTLRTYLANCFSRFLLSWRTGQAISAFISAILLGVIWILGTTSFFGWPVAYNVAIGASIALLHFLFVAQFQQWKADQTIIVYLEGRLKPGLQVIALEKVVDPTEGTLIRLRVKNSSGVPLNNLLAKMLSIEHFNGRLTSTAHLPMAINTKDGRGPFNLRQDEEKLIQVCRLKPDLDLDFGPCVQFAYETVGARENYEIDGDIDMVASIGIYGTPTPVLVKALIGKPRQSLRWHFARHDDQSRKRSV